MDTATNPCELEYVLTTTIGCDYNVFTMRSVVNLDNVGSTKIPNDISLNWKAPTVYSLVIPPGCMSMGLIKGHSVSYCLKYQFKIWLLRRHRSIDLS